MKKKRKVKKKYRLLFIIILLVIVLCFAYKKYYNSIPKTNEPINQIEEEIKQTKKKTYVDKIVNNSNTNIKEGWQELIVKYLDLYTKSLVNLESEDVTSLFANPDSNEAYLTQNALELLVEHHKMQENDMRLSEAKYDIEYKKVTINNNKVTINFLENDEYKFNFMNDITSRIIDVENTIVINKDDNDIYTIDSIRIVKDNYVMFTNVINESSTKEDIYKLKNKYLEYSREEVSKNRELLNVANTTKYESKKKCAVSYNRDKALEYAKKYVDSRNKDYYDFSTIGGNCMNYASQVIYAGGIPMDLEGNYKWKYYSSEVDSSSNRKGRTSSWTATKYFYEYAKNNTGYGLCSEVDVNIFYALAGDIVQVGYDGYTHTTVVVGNYQKDGKILDILVNSNTVGLENYPVMAYPYKNKRLIKILGYNE